MSQKPRIERASFADGVGWLSAGGDLMARGGAPLFRVATVLLLFSLLQLIPIIGLPMLLILSPALTAGMLQVFHEIDRGREFGPASMLSGLTDVDARRRLVSIGVVFIVGMFIATVVFVGWISDHIDLEALNRLMSDPQALNQDPTQLFALFEDISGFGTAAIVLGIVGLVLAATYFAVPLVFFWRWPVLAALVFSLRAVLVNWIAFLGFGLVVFGVLLLLSLMISMFGGILQLALGSIGTFLLQFLIILLSLFFQLLLAAAQWRAFLRVFPVGAEPEGPVER